MRELTVRIKFSTHCLGNVKAGKNGDGNLLLPKSPDGSVMFMASWHRQNMRIAAQLLGKHQDEVPKILWDTNVDGVVWQQRWHRRHYTAPNGKQRYILHEAFFPGQIVGINCAVPDAINDDDFWALMDLAGKYKGISPFKPGEYGFFVVDELRPRRPQMGKVGVETEKAG